MIVTRYSPNRFNLSTEGSKEAVAVNSPLFCAGIRRSWSSGSLCLGCATSGYYVRAAISPSAAELAKFIAELPAPQG